MMVRMFGDRMIEVDDHVWRHLEQLEARLAAAERWKKRAKAEIAILKDDINSAPRWKRGIRKPWRECKEASDSTGESASHE